MYNTFAGCSLMGLLLQVAVDFEAVVPRVCHGHVSFGGQCKTLRAVQRVCRSVDVRQERA